jgi:hypothetical protein
MAGRAVNIQEDPAHPTRTLLETAAVRKIGDQALKKATQSGNIFNPSQLPEQPSLLTHEPDRS